MESFSAWLESQGLFSSSPPSIAVTLTTLLILIVTTVCLYSPIDSFFLSQKLKRSGRPPLPPGSYGLPIIGEMFQFISNPVQFTSQRHAKYGPVFKTSVMGKAVFVEPPAGNKLVYAGDGKQVNIFFPQYFKKLFGRTSMLMRTGDVHRLARRHIMPFFNSQTLTQHVPRMELHVQNHFRDFWRCSGIDSDPGFELSLLESMKHLMFHLIVDLVLGLKLGDANFAKAEEMRHLHHALNQGILTMPINLPGTTFHKAVKAYARLIEIQGGLFEKRRAELRDGKASPTQDLMSYLLTQPDESGRVCTNEEVHDNMLLFVSAGHTTSSAALPMVLRSIALFPEVRQRVLEEHASITKKKNPGEGLTREDLAEMKYTWWTVQESMRMNAVLGGGFRIALQDIECGGFTIPKGWKVPWTAYGHHDPKIFENPEVFDPTRFNGSKRIVPFTFVPFSGGPHMCAGMEYAKMQMLVVIYHVMQEYTFTLVDPHNPLQYAPFPEQKNGTLVQVRRRNTAK